MSRQRRRRTAGASRVLDRETPRLGGFLTALGCFLVAAIVSGRLYFPSEDAYRGTGLTFILLGLLTGCVAGASRVLGRVTPRFGILELSWILFLSGYWLSIAVHREDFEARFLAWEWTAIFGVWLFVRSTPLERVAPGLFALLVGLALAQSLSAFWQLLVEFPNLRQMVSSRDPYILDQMRTIGVEPGTVTEFRFRARLEANEASGSFGHPNSLAGFLVFCLPLAASLMAAWRAQRPLLRGILVGLVGCCFVAMLATKSSSAVAATAIAGLGVAAFVCRRWIFGSSMARLLVPIAGVLIIAAAAGILWTTLRTPVDSLPGGLRSLKFRTEWWQGSAHVIAESPLWGVGFGRFASHYLKYKPEFSSEEIRDPHNFLIELWASVGIFAAAFYLALLAANLVSAARSAIQPTTESADQDRPTGGLGVWWWGAAAGVLLAVLTNDSAADFLSLLVNHNIWIWGIGLLTAWYCRGAFQDARLAAVGVVAAVSALHLQLLVSGGVHYPALMLPAWALLAAFSTRLPVDLGDRRIDWAWTAAFAGLTVAFLVLLYTPMQTRQHLHNQALRATNLQVRGRLLESYANVFPNDPEAWAQLAGFYAEALKSEQTSDRELAYQQATAAWNRGIALQPRRAGFRRQLGELHLLAWLQSLDVDGLSKAAEEFRRMVQSYPNSATYQWTAGYATLLEQSQKRLERPVQELAVKGFWEISAASSQSPPQVRMLADVLAPAVDSETNEYMRRALHLDQTPHIDKKLLEGQRDFAKQLLRQ